MKTITMYELLGMVKDGKELPKLENKAEENFEYYVYDKLGETCNLKDLKDLLNDEVEIIEEEPTQEEINEYRNKFLDVWEPVKKQFGKLIDEIARIGNDFNLEDELKEEHKIPEKIPYYSLEKIQKAKNKDEWQEERITLLEKRVNDLHIKMNDLLDYLESKGDE